MGKIKSKMIKKSGTILVKKGVAFNESFGDNKKILGNNTMPGKKLRNKMAGYLVRLKKQERVKQEEFTNLMNKKR